MENHRLPFTGKNLDIFIEGFLKKYFENP